MAVRPSSSVGSPSVAIIISNFFSLSVIDEYSFNTLFKTCGSGVNPCGRSIKVSARSECERTFRIGDGNLK